MEYCRFFNPRNIYYGAGALQSLATVSCQRALVTTDPAIRALGMVERVERILQANGAATRIFDQVEAEPSKETAWKAFHLAQEFKPDLFVGLGGGSCMDVGKVAWLLFEHPDLADMPNRIGVHALAHSMGAAFRIPHGRANALLLCPVFAFLYPIRKARLSSLAASLGIGGTDDRSKVANLLAALDELKAKVGIPLSIKDSGLEEKQWLDQIDQLAARDAEGRDSISFAEIKEIYLHAWNGTRAELKEQERRR